MRGVVAMTLALMLAGSVVVGRDTGEKDREWAFALEAGTRIDAAGQARESSDLREGDRVTVTYTNRDGKIVAQTLRSTQARGSATAPRRCGDGPLVRVYALAPALGQAANPSEKDCALDHERPAQPGPRRPMGREASTSL